MKPLLTGAATTVSHIGKVPDWWRKDPDHFAYIGRQREGMHFGNPFSCKPRSLAEIKVNTREESIEAFRQWIIGGAHTEVEPERRQWVLDNLWRLRGKTLVCFCHPRNCHGDVLAYLVDEAD